jgi:[ribosomal protein S5]-alanine N-acetyltransferase
MLPIIKTCRLVLRPLVPSDACDAHRFLSDERVMQYWSSGPHTDIGDTERYITGNCTGGTHESWAITEDGGPAIGWVNQCERRPLVYELGYILAADQWGKGLAREAVTAALEYAFGTLGARRVYADCDPDNLSSIRLVESLGFVHEGHLRAEWETHIGIRDSLIFGLLSHEWKARRD